MQHSELFTALFNKNNRDNGNAILLQEEAKNYPYFGAVHFFRLKEAGPGSAGYAGIAAKAALHFNNPLLLNLQLQQRTKKINTQPAPVINMHEPVIPPVVKEMLLKPKEAEKPVETKKEELLFEPLHTTDYFASQGIKLSEEVQTGDKLGKQLKSFTEWLKTMKNVHGNKLPVNTQTVDQAVQKMAENSNKEEDIITESMAEVFAQQGKMQKAREVYQKLSLQNPAKIAYFAAKIESLKEN